MNSTACRPLFSIIIPVYRNEKQLAACLDSIRNQTREDWECICIDDGSTDGSGAILDEYAGKDARFRVIHKRNEGVSAARNRGMELAQAPYLMFVDADDELLPETLQACRETMMETAADMVVFGAGMISRTGEWTGFMSPAIRPLPPDSTASFHERTPFVENNNIPACWAKIYKKEILVKNKIKFPENVKFAEDLYFTAQYFCHCCSVTVINKPFYQYSADGETGVTSNFFNCKRPLEDYVNALHAVLNLSACIDGRSPYGRNYFLRSRSLLALFRLPYSNYKLISGRIKSLYPEHEQTIRKESFSALKKYATLANLPLILYFSLKSNYGRTFKNWLPGKKHTST